MANPKDDFDPKSIAQEHQKDIGDLKARITSLEDKFGTSEALAKTFAEAASTQVKIQEVVTSFIVKQINENPKVEEEFNKFLSRADRSFLMGLIKKIGFAGWSAILFIAGAILYGFFQNLFSR